MSTADLRLSDHQQEELGTLFRRLRPIRSQVARLAHRVQDRSSLLEAVENLDAELEIFETDLRCLEDDTGIQSIAELRAENAELTRSAAVLAAELQSARSDYDEARKTLKATADANRALQTSIDRLEAENETLRQTINDKYGFGEW